MEATHNIKYEGLDLEVHGEFEVEEPCTGYKGGWSCWSIEANGVDLYWMLNDLTIKRINEIVIEENY